jgi:hypothetical protein
MSGEQAVQVGVAAQADWHEADKAVTFGGWRTVHERAQPGYTIQIAGATHLSFMDAPFLPAEEGSLVAPMLAATTIDPHRMWRITGDLLLAFFAKHLDGHHRTLLVTDHRTVTPS